MQSSRDSWAMTTALRCGSQQDIFGDVGAEYELPEQRIADRVGAAKRDSYFDRKDEMADLPAIPTGALHASKACSCPLMFLFLCWVCGLHSSLNLSPHLMLVSHVYLVLCMQGLLGSLERQMRLCRRHRLTHHRHRRRQPRKQMRRQARPCRQLTTTTTTLQPMPALISNSGASAAAKHVKHSLAPSYGGGEDLRLEDLEKFPTICKCVTRKYFCCRAQQGYDASAYGGAVPVQYDAYGQPIVYDTAMQVGCPWSSLCAIFECSQAMQRDTCVGSLASGLRPDSDVLLYRMSSRPQLMATES